MVYHPTSRVLTVLELLQTHQRLSGPQLAQRLEVDVRTVRRYVAMLQDIGIPIEAELGRHGCYTLRPGYKLPPLLFTNDEATALTLGLLLAQRLGLSAATPAVPGALAKLERVLPDVVRAQVQALQTALTIDIAAHEATVESSVLSLFSLAVREQQRLAVRYESRGGATERALDPYGVVYHGGRWYAVGHCHLRGGVRVFRLDRVRSIALAGQHFERPADFDALGHLQHAIASIPDRWNVTALLHTTLDHARRSLPPGLAILRDQPEGVLLQASINDLAVVARALVQLGCRFSVLEPPELRAVLREQAREILELTEEEPMPAPDTTDIEAVVEHHYADNDGVKIHYVTLGAGPLLVMLHGFPDFWYTWRYQMPALAAHYRVVALDLRGYNLSDKPQGGEHYRMPLLLGDVAAVIRDAGHKHAIIAGHDWGGVIAWQFATHLPHMTERLIVLNLPHPRGLARELAHNPAQQKNSQYARNFQQEGAHTRLSAERLTEWVSDPAARERYIAALERSDFEAMLHYYKQNYPRPPYQEDRTPVVKVQAPVLQIHGLQDWALLPGGLNNTWEWLEQDWTLVTIPNAGHFVQQDAAELVTRAMLSWLRR